MNLGQLYTEIGRLLNDPSNQRWSTTVLLDRINQAQRTIQAYTKAVVTKENLTPTANSAILVLDAGVMDIQRASILRSDGSLYPLEGITRYELDYRYPNWENWDAGEPVRYYYEASFNQLYLVPKPDAANALLEGVSVWEIQMPADLANTTDIPFDSNAQMIPYHTAIVHWVVAVCFMDDGTQEALAKSSFHKSGMIERPGEFEKQIKLITARFDSLSDVPANVLWKPQGGRIGRNSISKSYPFSS